MKINNYIISFALGLAVSGTLASCSDLDEKFYNPDKITEADFSLLFASAQTQDTSSDMIMEQHTTI